MNNKKFIKYLEEILEKHMPVYFMDIECLSKVIEIIGGMDEMSKREVLILAYIIGADELETNELLIMKGHLPLYVKKREDAIWKYAIKRNEDVNSIIERIFPQNEDE